MQVAVSRASSSLVNVAVTVKLSKLYYINGSIIVIGIKCEVLMARNIKEIYVCRVSSTSLHGGVKYNIEICVCT